jgi:2,4-dienoyl-CoA reductase-like NADH-dependent reductase (Old Yellow Enzyme family)
MHMPLPVDVLFQPFRLKSLTLNNRIVMAPMTRCFCPQGAPGENVAAYYRRRAAGEVGLILSEGTAIDRPASSNDPNVPHFYGDAALSGWKRIIDEVHAAGGKMAPQLWHVGSMPNTKTEWRPAGVVESPSGLVGPGQSSGEAMTEAAVVDTIAAFGRAAREAARLGFDALEVHGAHGYLVDQFFWAVTNQRTDRFGGATLEDRTRFAADVIKSMRKEVGPDFPLILRLSQFKQQDYACQLAETPAAMEKWLGPLAAAGVDAFHCSQRRFWQPEFPQIDGESGLNFAGWAKKLTGVATISVGSVGLSGDAIAAFGGASSNPASLDSLILRMERNEFDLIAVGRALLSDPCWVTKVRTSDHGSLQPFTPAAFAHLA